MQIYLIDFQFQVHQLASGELLLSAVFDKALTAVTSDAAGSLVFVGSADGAVHEVSLLEPPRGRVLHVDSAGQGSYRGHTQVVSALSVSADGLTLASGSSDGQVMLWHIPSRQRIRTISHTSPVTCVMFVTAPRSMFRDEPPLKSILSSFQRNLTVDSGSLCSIQAMHREDLPLPFTDDRGFCGCSVDDRLQDSMPVSLQEEIDKVRLINGQLYRFFMDRIVERADCQCDQNTNIKPSKKKIRLE